MKIFLDIDDVIFYWGESYAAYYNTRVPRSWASSDLFKRRLDNLAKDKDFWITLPIKNIPNFQPSGYVSARGIPKAWTKESLKRNKVPGRSNIHQVHWGQSKLDLLKSLDCDIFIDDKPSTFKECNENGVFCLLMDDHKNRHVKTDFRIYDLDINTIMDKYDSLCNNKS